MSEPNLDQAVEAMRQNRWALARPFGDIDRAHMWLARFIAALPADCWLDSSSRRSAKVTRPRLISNCPEMDQLDFQALHFDMGAPIVPSRISPQFTCLFSALYHPGGADPGRALTRILNLKTASQPLPTPASLPQLQAYAAVHGDGWARPTPGRTGRLACFARVLDAALKEPPALAHYFDYATWQWFRDGEFASGLASEAQFCGRFGIDLEKTETRVRLQPGELLIFDNLRCAHGRVGARPLKAVYHIMIGLEDTPDELVDASARHLSAFLDYVDGAHRG